MEAKKKALEDNEQLETSDEEEDIYQSWTDADGAQSCESHAVESCPEQGHCLLRGAAYDIPGSSKLNYCLKKDDITQIVEYRLIDMFHIKYTAPKLELKGQSYSSSKKPLSIFSSESRWTHFSSRISTP